MSVGKDVTRVCPDSADKSDPLYCWFPNTQESRHDSVVIYDRTELESGAWVSSDVYRRVER